jgi:glycosyltransferase involved in cell wall biosynthesis
MLHVVGDGNDKPRLEQLARDSGYAPFVHFHGRLDDSRLQAAYASARVFAMPSAKEGFGIVFLEAMRYGVPCVGGAHGGTPEVFRHDVEGFTVTYGDVDGLAACLEALARDESRRQAMGAAGQQRFERDYSFGAFASRWEQMLGEVQSGRIGLS